MSFKAGRGYAVRFLLFPAPTNADSNAQRQAKNDALSSLPNDIATSIFAFASADSPTQPCLFKGISRALLPFTTAALYADVTVTTYSRIALFCRSLQANSALGPLILCLSVEVPRSKSKTLKPPEAIICYVLSTMTGLATLEVHGSSKFAALLLEEAGDEIKLPSLKTLTLEDVFGGYKNVFDPELYRTLARFPTLSHFGLDVAVVSDDLGCPAPPEGEDEDEVVEIPTITSLAIKGRLGANALKTFLGAFPRVVTLSLAGTRPLDIESIIASSTSLESLALGANSFSDPSLAFLRPLSLHHLAFASLEIVDGPSLLSFLSDLPESQRPTELEIEVEEWAHKDKVYPVPKWPDAFTYEDALALRRWGEKKGVDLKGSIVEGIRAQDLWDKIREKRRRRRAANSEEWDDVRSKYR